MPMMRFALYGLLWFGLAIPAAGLPPDSAEWYLLESRGLVALTDGNPDRAEALIGELLDFRVALEASLPPGPDADGRPLRLFLFRDPEILKEVEKIIDLLGAGSYEDREAATRELIKIGKGVVPLLRKHLKHPDAEIRQRIGHIIKKLGVKE